MVQQNINDSIIPVKSNNNQPIILNIDKNTSRIKTQSSLQESRVEIEKQQFQNEIQYLDHLNIEQKKQQQKNQYVCQLEQKFKNLIKQNDSLVEQQISLKDTLYKQIPDKQLIEKAMLVLDNRHKKLDLRKIIQEKDQNKDKHVQLKEKLEKKMKMDQIENEIYKRKVVLIDRIKKLEESKKLLQQELEKRESNKLNVSLGVVKKTGILKKEQEQLKEKVSSHKKEIDVWKNRYDILEKKIVGIQNQENSKKEPYIKRIQELELGLQDMMQENEKLNDLMETEINKKQTQQIQIVKQETKQLQQIYKLEQQQKQLNQSLEDYKQEYENLLNQNQLQEQLQ